MRFPDLRQAGRNGTKKAHGGAHPGPAGALFPFMENHGPYFPFGVNPGRNDRMFVSAGMGQLSGSSHRIRIFIGGIGPIFSSAIWIAPK